MAPLSASRSLRLISFREIMTAPLLPINWLIEALIAVGDRIVVYGEFGALKSWVLLHLALHLAAGRPWLGKFGVPRPHSVLYIDEEMNERTLRRRIKRLGRGSDLEHEDLPLRM